MSEILKKEDYLEPACVLCEPAYGTEPAVWAVPLRRIMEKLDELYAHKDYDGAERLIGYWLEEASLGYDTRGAISLRSELLGIYRKTSQKEKALAEAERVLSLLDAESSPGISEATALVNTATVFDAFGYAERALPLFAAAGDLYEKYLPEGDSRLGGLYNNHALAQASCHRYEEAMSLFEKALKIMENTENGELEQAITFLNMADCREEELGPEEAETFVTEYLEQAEKLLFAEALPKNGYYAFVCEKCAPVFDYYGWFADAAELKRRAKDIYDRT